MNRVLAASLVAAAVAVAFLLGSLAGASWERARGQDPDPPCEDGEAPTPAADGCVPEEAACNVFGQVVAAQTLACQARSDDGKATVRPVLVGRGRVDVRVEDGAGNLVFSKSYAVAQGSPRDVPLSGKPGLWRLQVTFSDVQGDVRVVLWG